MKMPSVGDALAGKWPGWVTSNGNSYEEMPIGRVFADAVLLPTGQVRETETGRGMMLYDGDAAVLCLAPRCLAVTQMSQPHELYRKVR